MFKLKQLSKKNSFLFLLLLSCAFSSCQPAEQSISETTQASTSVKSERISSLQKLWTTTHAAIVTSSQHYRQVKTAVGENPSAETDMLLQQVNSALHTQQEMTTTLKEINKM